MLAVDWHAGMPALTGLAHLLRRAGFRRLLKPGSNVPQVRSALTPCRSIWWGLAYGICEPGLRWWLSLFNCHYPSISNLIDIV